MSWDRITNAINDLGIEFNIKTKRSISGGSINEAWHISDGAYHFFVKRNNHSGLEMFEAEQEGLKAILDTGTIRVPRPLTFGVDGHSTFLVLEYVPLSKTGNSAMMGQHLAEMHRHTVPRFGWHRDNTIGSTPQQNRWDNDWVSFWKKHRLGYQVALAEKKGLTAHIIRLCEELIERLECFFHPYHPAPSLLHGDLWGGNAGYDGEGKPVIFDPACYYGDRETDLAMTELFGGFEDNFYAAYNDSWPLDPGYSSRKTLYNLYHILNHYNLFGESYSQRAQHMTEALLSECR